MLLISSLYSAVMEFVLTHIHPHEAKYHNHSEFQRLFPGAIQVLFSSDTFLKEFLCYHFLSSSLRTV